MSVVVQLFTRTPFDVQAVQVTTANIGEVAAWCKGTVHQSPRSLYVKLNIPDAKSSVRTNAFPGDWILLSDQGYRIYTEKALTANFDPKVAPKVSDDVRKAAIRELVINAISSHDEAVHPRANNRVNKIVDETVEKLLKAV